MSRDELSDLVGKLHAWVSGSEGEVLGDREVSDWWSTTNLFIMF